MGQCGLSCVGGSTKCGTLCVDLQTDPANCGMCGNPCASGELCSAGQCALVCGSGTTQCGNVCVDTQVDPSNCGMCGTACLGGEVCGAGQCALVCPNGTTKCGNSCVDLQTNPQHCGTCAIACNPNQPCFNGQCYLNCPMPTINCNQLCKDITSDPQNCGGCGITCDAGDFCVNGVCGCLAGQTDCGATGCADLLTDPQHCGTCATVCPMGQTCNTGTCGCPMPGQTYCGGAIGCVNLQTDSNNCGMCGLVCPPTQTCNSGACSSLFTFSGVLNDVPIASLNGWTQCYMDTYADASSPLSTILSACSQTNLLMGCRQAGSPMLHLAAHAPRVDVIFNTGGANTPHNANGVGWYYADSWSWGFALAGDPIDLFSCDIVASSLNPAGPNPDKRLCWHTGGGFINAGWRCGSADSLFGPNYERLVFQAP
jgi:hypothetical protein